ncbi:MAG: DUF3987 domain-containing protein [Chloroflexota bacterium]
MIQDYDAVAFDTVRLLQSGQNLPESSETEYGPWQETILAIAEASEPDRNQVIEALTRQDRRVAALLANYQESPSICSDLDMPPLPYYAQTVAPTESNWLDDYIEFSRNWSPRACDDFHEATGIWVLSSIATRRVALNFGGKRYTPLFILLAAPTSKYAKTTTAKIAVETIGEAGLSWLLSPDSTTPQKFIQDLTLRLPDGYERMVAAEQERVQNRLRFTAQRGWYYEEFGQQIKAMNRAGGNMEDFRGLLRRLDDCYDRYEAATIGRGTDVVERPYLALLGNITPDDLRPFASQGNTLWGDGFWARFAFVAPSFDYPRGRARFPLGERKIPQSIWQPLRTWHRQLGIHDLSIVGDEAHHTYQPPKTCSLDPKVVEAYYTYNDALDFLSDRFSSADLNGNYARFAEKALRVAMLLASLENRGKIEMQHWARGQAVAERWRQGLHSLRQQLSQQTPNEKRILEDKIVLLITKKGPRTVREMSQSLWGFSSADLQAVVKGMVQAEILIAQPRRQTIEYGIKTM